MDINDKLEELKTAFASHGTNHDGYDGEAASPESLAHATTLLTALPAESLPGMEEITVSPLGWFMFQWTDAGMFGIDVDEKGTAHFASVSDDIEISGKFPVDRVPELIAAHLRHIAAQESADLTSKAVV